MRRSPLRRQAELPSIEDVVRQAWMETLPDQPFNPSLGWEESGADSIASLHLLLRLERALGRKLPFDLLSPEMSASDLARSLQVLPGSVSGPCLQVFLVPGIFGDEPLLAGFRRSFAGRIRFQLLELPDIVSPTAILTDLAAHALAVAGQIESSQPEGKVHLAGFSFGGAVAYEAARHLMERGRRVGFIGLLDAVIDEGMFKAGSEDNKPGSVSVFRMLRDAVVRAVVALCTRDMVRRLILSCLNRHSSEDAFRLGRRVLWRFRLRAMRDWVLAPLPAQHGAPAHVLLAVTERFAPMTVAKWTKVCPGLQVVMCAGEHVDVLRPSAWSALHAAFDTAMMLPD